MAKNVNHYHKKAPLQIFNRFPKAPLRLYFHSLFILGINLSLEFTFQLKLCLRISRSLLRILSNIFHIVHLQNSTKFCQNQFQSSQNISHIYLRICALITLKALNTNLQSLSSGFLRLHCLELMGLCKLLLLMLCDDFVNLS